MNDAYDWTSLKGQSEILTDRLRAWAEELRSGNTLPPDKVAAIFELMADRTEMCQQIINSYVQLEGLIQ